MNHEETLEAIRLRDYVKKLDVDDETRARFLAGMPEPKSVPWDLVSETIKAREEVVSQSDPLDNMITYYRNAVFLAEGKLAEAMELKESLSEEKENIVLEAWG